MRFALEPDLKVVGEAGDAVEAIPLARTLHPQASPNGSCWWIASEP